MMVLSTFSKITYILSNYNKIVICHLFERSNNDSQTYGQEYNLYYINMASIYVGKVEYRKIFEFWKHNS